jgi:hypothetical protein
MRYRPPVVEEVKNATTGLELPEDAAFPVPPRITGPYMVVLKFQATSSSQ